MKNIISSIFAILWFFCVLGWALLFGILFFMVTLSDIVGMLKSGFATPEIGLAVCFYVGLILAITGWVPAFRKCYYWLPWLYPLSMMMTMDLFIISIAAEILNKGLSVISTPRYVITVILMIAQIIVCRLLMCWYLKRNPMILHKYDRIE